MTDNAAIQSFYAASPAVDLPHIERAEGPYLWDRSGRRYVDAASGPVVTNIGHGNPHVVEAIARQAATCTFASRTAFVSDANQALGERLAKLCGPGHDRAFFTSGGSEAIEASLKFARQVAWVRGERKRWKVISRNPSYHGSTLGALSVTGDEEIDDLFGPMMRQMPKVATPFTYRIPEGYTPQGWQEAAAADLEQTILREGPETCLAFILEPIGGLATGALVASEAYYNAVRRICSRHGLLLIYDEVMSGAGRSGAFLSAHHWRDAKPDLVVLAKGLGAGYTPLGAMMAPRDLVELVAAAGGFLHGHTYVANPLTCATGLAVLDEVERQSLIQNAARLGPKLSEILRQIMAHSPIVGDVRGLGLLMAIEVVADQCTKRPFPLEVEITKRIARLAMKHGLIIYARRTSHGKFGEWVMIGPPLNADEELLGEIGSKLQACLTDCVDELLNEGILTGGIQAGAELRHSI
ncbi:aspartate aminotransferase family protein [Pelagibius sp.]|uniref:aminotransferase family protein n=1 Tax=Pelagibius sp. TaxID=1931238 RepID=UPI003BB0D675